MGKLIWLSFVCLAGCGGVEAVEPSAERQAASINCWPRPADATLTAPDYRASPKPPGMAGCDHSLVVDVQGPPGKTLQVQTHDTSSTADKYQSVCDQLILNVSAY